MKSLALITVALVVTLLSFGQAMGQKKLSAVSPSTWGGAGVEFVVGDKSVTIQYDCAEGEIPKRLEVDRRGIFATKGFHKYLPPGPIRLDFPPKSLPARYEGKITDGSITYKVFLTETGKLVGQFSAERGKEARITRCR